ncbi:hypothetical protein TRICI_003246 [Trichomonascus ciferrii]|uniref:Ribosomal protein S21 n=1 Tax=Trichomonascus ciferrii TaxID=44093 RepID=A0A642V4D8_9ASCO|nr:hypothetical protein TRICI_003246 [Trichomonascus ciferrii]
MLGTRGGLTGVFARRSPFMMRGMLFSTSPVRFEEGGSDGKQGRAHSDFILKLLETGKPGDGSGRKMPSFQSPTLSNIPESMPPGTHDELVAPEKQEEAMNRDFLNQHIPRTGVNASRSVVVNGQNGGLQAALRILRIKNSANKVPRTVNLQRYHEKPGKKKQRLQMEKQQREFNMGIRRLFKLVNEARRKGY